ncbi:hypothetical protein GCM10007415_37740 [Parapedobacter pyrenivorans]|uniref:DUF2490 domain-containing protein n=1 Tax=Parapedobacter pyrenivorans TaxID=1305674 RepID=A0A917HZL9_9SPHI|nr:hypothetical protein GCM10007415_37740 [Parapedobacter pyrenivorans]
MKHLRLNYLLVLTTLSLTPEFGHAQDHVFGGWAGWFNNVRFSENWGMNNDIQFRTGKDWNTNSLLLIRPGVNYYVNTRQTASVGYAATLVTSQLPVAGNRLTEHRIWQQYIINGDLLRMPTQHRFRLEQRFLRRPDETVFAQRARYFIRGMIPLSRPLGERFERGAFISLQNELFFNIHNKAALNGRLLDQNRAYASVGFRISSRYDIEAGYMNQFLLRNAMPNAFTHIAQIALYTRL